MKWQDVKPGDWQTLWRALWRRYRVEPCSQFMYHASRHQTLREALRCAKGEEGGPWGIRWYRIAAEEGSEAAHMAGERGDISSEPLTEEEIEEYVRLAREAVEAL